MSRRSICVLTSSFPSRAGEGRAAAGLFVRDFAIALGELGHGVRVVTPATRPVPAADEPGLAVSSFSWRGGDAPVGALRPYRPGDVLDMVSLVRNGSRALDRLVAGEGFDHIIAMWAAPSGVLAWRQKRRNSIPYTTWCLGSDLWVYARYPGFRQILREVLRSSDLLYADGSDLARDAERLSGRPCGFLPAARRLNRGLGRPLDLAPAPVRFLFVGRYARVKGVDVLLEAMAQYRSLGGLGSLHVFGGGPLEASVLERAARDDLRGCVVVGGYADEGTMVSYLRACDCLVIPSRLESIPVVLGDAAQMECPVIATDVGDLGRVVRSHAAGIVVQPDDAEALARAMFSIERHGAARFRPGTRALARRLDPTEAAREWCRVALGEARRAPQEVDRARVAVL